MCKCISFLQHLLLQLPLHFFSFSFIFNEVNEATIQKYSWKWLNFFRVRMLSVEPRIFVYMFAVNEKFMAEKREKICSRQSSFLIVSPFYILDFSLSILSYLTERCIYYGSEKHEFLCIFLFRFVTIIFCWFPWNIYVSVTEYSRPHIFERLGITQSETIECFVCKIKCLPIFCAAHWQYNGFSYSFISRSFHVTLKRMNCCEYGYTERTNARTAPSSFPVSICTKHWLVFYCYFPTTVYCSICELVLIFIDCCCYSAAVVWYNFWLCDTSVSSSFATQREIKHNWKLNQTKPLEEFLECERFFRIKVYKIYFSFPFSPTLS